MLNYDKRGGDDTHVHKIFLYYSSIFQMLGIVHILSQDCVKKNRIGRKKKLIIDCMYISGSIHILEYGVGKWIGVIIIEILVLCTYQLSCNYT